MIRTRFICGTAAKGGGTPARRRRHSAAKGAKILTAFLTVIVLGVSAQARGDTEAEYKRLLDTKSPVYVTVKFVLKTQGGFFGNNEDESEARGIMIDPKGLVLCSNRAFGGGIFARRSGGATPKDIKILIGEDTEGVDARFLARDSELDLAWVQIKEPGDKTFAYLDLSKAKKPKLGQRLLSLHRLGKYYDRAFVVSEGRLAGRTKKPRDLLIPGGGLIAMTGMPVFTEDGSVIGFVVMQFPSEDEMSSGHFSLFSGGFAPTILPSADVAKATQRAREADEDDEEDEPQQDKATTQAEGEDD